MIFARLSELSDAPEDAAELQAVEDAIQGLGDAVRGSPRCKVSGTHIGGVDHSVDVTAETQYEAFAAPFAALCHDDWVGEIAHGMTTVSIVVQQPSVRYKVTMQDFLSSLVRKIDSPAEMVLKNKIEKILADPSRPMKKSS